jgi:hypothetical protein
MKPDRWAFNLCMIVLLRRGNRRIQHGLPAAGGSPRGRGGGGGVQSSFTGTFTFELFVPQRGSGMHGLLRREFYEPRLPSRAADVPRFHGAP